jgi:hypothetical protein
MANPEQAREESHYRQAEDAMLFMDEAGRRALRVADQLRKDGAETFLVNALETAAGAMRAEHSRLMRSIYYLPAPAAAALVSRELGSLPI